MPPVIVERSGADAHAPAPDCASKFFPTPLPALEPGARRLLACVTVYNESAQELRDTLVSLADEAATLDNCYVAACVVLDGWRHACPSMRAYVDDLFGDQLDQPDSPRDVMTPMLGLVNAGSMPGLDGPMIATPLCSAFDAALDAELAGTLSAASSDSGAPPTGALAARLDAVAFSGATAHHTVVIESSDPECGHMSEVEIAPGRRLLLTVVAKVDNRRKADSHEFFLRGYAQRHAEGAAFLLFLDVGTTTTPGCLRSLTSRLDAEPGRYAAAVAFQRPVVAENALRADGTTMNIGALGRVHAWAQRYEFFAANFGAVAAFATTGFQPVINGPCQLLDASCALDSAFQAEYFSLMRESPATLGLLPASMQLAEDRPFTKYLWFSSKRRFAFVPEASFNYPVETEGAGFLGQRRRWHNGSLAASLLMLLGSAAAGRWHEAASRGETGALRLMRWYTLSFLFALLAPGLFGGAAFFTAAHAVQGFGVVDAFSPSAVRAGTGAAFSVMALHALFTAVHHFRKYCKPVYVACVALNAAAVLAIFAWSTASGLHDYGFKLVLSFFGANAFFLCLPGLMAAALGDRQGLLSGSLFVLPYALFAPTYNLVVAYSVARCWDLTWGNRGPDAGDKACDPALDAAMRRNYRLAAVILVLYVAANWAVAGALCWAVAHTSPDAVLPFQALFYGAALLPNFSWFPLGCTFVLRRRYAPAVSAAVSVVCTRAAAAVDALSPARKWWAARPRSRLLAALLACALVACALQAWAVLGAAPGAAATRVVLAAAPATAA